MESSSLAEDRLSLESTVTSLLSSSGHLRSNLRPPELNSSFRYRNKDYDSASAALDAYIADFEKSCQNCQSLTGSLVLPHDPPSSLTKPRVGSLRNRDVLRERLTDRELDFLKLPVTSFLHHGNSDRFSLTTDELLSISYDGSMPVTHTSAFPQGLLSRSRTSQLCSSSTRCRRNMDLFTSAAGSSSAHRADHHLPRWLTSNKSVMDWSGIGSLPDLNYPAWVRRCDVTELDAWENCAGPPRTRAPSWVSNLEKDNGPHGTPGQEESRSALRDVRVQFAQELLLLAAGGEGSNDMSVLFRENRVESLIEKADQVLNLLSQTSDKTESSACSGRPVNSEDLLLSSPPPCSPSFQSGSGFCRDSAAAGGLEVPAGRDVEISVFHGNGIWKQPGPVEAVKQMLFRLQAVEAELERQQKELATPPLFTCGPKIPENLLADCEAELLSGTPSPSLQRVLHHLTHLKLLVEEPRQKNSDEEVEEEDERHYGSEQEPS